MNEYYNNCSERAWKCNFPSFVGNYGRQNDGPTERPTDWHEGGKLHLQKDILFSSAVEVEVVYEKGWQAVVSA